MIAEADVLSLSILFSGAKVFLIVYRAVDTSQKIILVTGFGIL